MAASYFQLRTFTLALIDDDPVYQVILERQLERHGQSVHLQYFSAGPEALQFYHQHYRETLLTPDVILLDLNLPMLNGWEVLEEIQAIPFAQRPTVYILSSSIDPEDEQKARKHPAVAGFLAKPLYLEDIKMLFGKAA